MGCFALSCAWFLWRPHGLLFRSTHESILNTCSWSFWLRYYYQVHVWNLDHMSMGDSPSKLTCGVMVTTTYVASRKVTPITAWLPGFMLHLATLVGLIQSPTSALDVGWLSTLDQVVESCCGWHGGDLVTTFALVPFVCLTNTCDAPL